MPEAYTHIRIARMAQDILKDSIGPIENVSAYEMGANGPDPLFAHRVWSKRRPLEALAQKMHTEQCGRFLRAMIFRAYTPAQRDYTMGFLTHYAADTTLHPYVQAQAGQGGQFDRKEGHAFCESAMDTYFYEKDGQPTPMNGQQKAPSLSPNDLAEVTALLKACIGEVYHTEVTQEDLADGFHAFRWLHTRVLTVGQQKHAKRAGLTLVECLVLRRPGFVRSHMTPANLPAEGFRSEWNDPVTGCANTQGPDALCEMAAQEAARMMKMTFAYWRGVAAPEQLAVALGDKNYLTGQLSQSQEAENTGTLPQTAPEPPAETPAAPAVGAAPIPAESVLPQPAEAMPDAPAEALPPQMGEMVPVNTEQAVQPISNLPPMMEPETSAFPLPQNPPAGGAL